MKRFAVLLASATPNPTSLPSGWPVETRELPTGESAAAPWVEMTEEELADHIAANAAAKEAWNAAQEAVRPSILSAKEFLDRFTVPELVAISTACRTDALLDVLFRKLTAADNVRLDSAELASGLDYVVGLGLLTAERREALVSI